MNKGHRSFIDPSLIRSESFHAMYLKDPVTGCWNWNRATNFKGYGQFSVKGRVKQAHRVSYVMATGEQPNLVMHTCDNPACVNPAHLRDGNNHANMLDCQRKGRRPRPKGMKNIFEMVEGVIREFH